MSRKLKNSRKAKTTKSIKLLSGLLVIMVLLLAGLIVWDVMLIRSTKQSLAAELIAGTLEDTKTPDAAAIAAEDEAADTALEENNADTSQTDANSPQEEAENEPDDANAAEETAGGTVETTKEVEDKLAGMSLEEKVSQLFIITPEALTGVKQVTAAGDTTKDAFKEHPVGGVIYFSKNITNGKQVTEMIKNMQSYSEEVIGLPAFISVDEEGGEVVRVAKKPGIDARIFYNLSEVGAEGKVESGTVVGDEIGRYLSDLGFNLNFAPVADVLTNPDNTVVKNRCFGSDAQFVSDIVVAELEGLESRKVYGCLKHFPGHGCTEGDSHDGYAYTDQKLEDMIDDEMLPFKNGIDAGASFIMVGHISAPNIIGDETPSSLSNVMITDILRGQLGFKGIVITDALNMEAVKAEYDSSQACVKALQAGTDMLLMPDDFQKAYDGVLAAVNDGTLSQERINDSVRRILMVKMEI